MGAISKIKNFSIDLKTRKDIQNNRCFNMDIEKIKNQISIDIAKAFGKATEEPLTADEFAIAMEVLIGSSNDKFVNEDEKFDIFINKMKFWGYHIDSEDCGSLLNSDFVKETLSKLPTSNIENKQEISDTLYELLTLLEEDEAT